MISVGTEGRLGTDRRLTGIAYGSQLTVGKPGEQLGHSRTAPQTVGAQEDD